MKKYFIHNGKEQQGPYTLDELKQQGITSNTMIWYNGLTNWTEANLIPEISEFTIATPPPFDNSNQINETLEKAKKVLENDYVNILEEKIPNNTGKLVFKYLLIILSLIGLIFLVFKLMPTTEGKEQNNPDKFLSIENARIERYYNPYSGYENSKGGELNGIVVNDATLVTYKDIKIKIEYFTATKTLLGSDTVIIYETFPPKEADEKNGIKTSFNVKITKPIPENFDPNETKFKITDAAVFDK